MEYKMQCVALQVHTQALTTSRIHDTYIIYDIAVVKKVPVLRQGQPGTKPRSSSSADLQSLRISCMSCIPVVPQRRYWISTGSKLTHREFWKWGSIPSYSSDEEALAHCVDLRLCSRWRGSLITRISEWISRMYFILTHVCCVLWKQASFRIAGSNIRRTSGWNPCHGSSNNNVKLQQEPDLCLYYLFCNKISHKYFVLSESRWIL